MTGSPEEGVELHRRTIQIYRELENRAGEATSLYSLGHSYYALGRYEEALECYTQAVPIAREVEDPEAEGIALNRIGMVHRMLNRPRDAVRYHLHALQIMRDAKIALNEGRILYELMLDWKALSQPQLAIYYGKQSINVQQTIRSGLRSLDEGSQQSFIKDKEEIYRDLADMLITAGRLPEAEQVINLLKQEEYLEFIHRDQANAPTVGHSAADRRRGGARQTPPRDHRCLAALGAERGALLDKQLTHRLRKKSAWPHWRPTLPSAAARSRSSSTS